MDYKTCGCYEFTIDFELSKSMRVCNRNYFVNNNITTSPWIYKIDKMIILSIFIYKDNVVIFPTDINISFYNQLLISEPGDEDYKKI